MKEGARKERDERMRGKEGGRMTKTKHSDK